jgi:hypothetical protein
MIAHSMDLPEDSISETADAYVAFIQKQMNHLSEDLRDGQDIEVVVPLPNGNQITATWFGYHNPDIIKINGQDAQGMDVCLLVHKTKLEVLLRKVNLNRNAKSDVNFQQFEEQSSALLSHISMDALETEPEDEPPLDETA